MSMTPANQLALKELLAALREGQMTSEQSAQLNALLREDASARQRYLEQHYLCAALHWLHGDDAEVTDNGVSPAPPATPFDALSAKPGRSPVLGFLGRVTAPLSRPVFWSICVVGAMFCLYAGTLLWNLRSGDLSSGTDGNDLVVATIRDESDVQWSSLTPASTRGEVASIAPNQSLSITAGLVELQLNGGTTLLIEGPADWQINGENSATLTHGKLVAKVPQQAIGFTLQTPTAKIIDLGTEFGVAVAKDGVADVHVVKGEVDVRSIGGSVKPGPGKLQAGQSAQITPAGNTVQNNSTLPDKFKRLVEAGNKKEQIAAKPGSPLDRWREASQKLRDDPSLVAYYDFESQGKQLKNVLADKLHGEIITKREKTPWTRGRWHGKSALAFGKDFASVTVADDPALLPDSDWSVAVWFRVDALPVSPVPADHALIVGKGNYPLRSYALWLKGNGHLLWSANTTGGNGQTYFLSARPLTLNRWNLAVGVIDSGLMRLYVNGVEVSDPKPIVGVVASDKQPLAIGRSLESDRAEPFTGVIDELAIYGRALGAAEIADMYRIGKPER